MGDQSQAQSVDEQGDHSTLPAVTYVWADNHKGCMLNLLKTGAGSDLTLLLGPQRTPIKVHSLILMARSQKFQTRLDSKTDLAEGTLPWFKSTVQELRLEDEDAEIFTIFLEEIYTGNCTVEITQALPLLKIATDYGVKDLANKCSDILQGGLNHKNAIIIFSQAMECFNKELIEPSLECICKNASAVLKSKDFANLRLECLVEILKQDDLKVTNEIEVFEAAYRWGKAECERQKLDPQNSKDLRKVLNKALAYIRFPNMRQNEFALNVATKSILDESELISLMISFMVSPSERSQLSSGRFMSTPRAYTDTRLIGRDHEEPKYYVSRRHPQLKYAPQTYTAKPCCVSETLLFRLSQPAKLCGINIFEKMFCVYEFSYPAQFCYQFDQIFLNITLSKISDGCELVKCVKNFDYELCLGPVKLEAGELYKIHLSYSGPIKCKQKNKNAAYHELSDLQMKASFAYPLHVGTGYKWSEKFTARNSVGELETITVDFCREDGDTKMAITEGFIEKLIFQME